jgi:hypothetical protein
MKASFILSLLFLNSFGAMLVWADTIRFGDHSAVMAFDPDEGFKMRDLALQTLGIRFHKLDNTAPWRAAKQSLVYIKHTTGVYRRLNGWISFVLVNVKAKKGDTVMIESEDLQAGDEIAVEGALYLRMTEADLNSDTADNCSH